ncbi:MAG: tetratricopeptide repeat protein [Opitutales bacterium]|nr:tetratricopeptide repeat protein [Opitutales bacterium]
MHRLIYTLLLASFLCLPASGNAWWIFGGKKDEWKNISPAEQDRLAEGFYSEGMAAYSAGRMGKAEDLLEKVYLRFPGSSYAPDALYTIAKINMADYDWNTAYNACQRILTYYPNYGKFDELIEMQFKVAEAFEEGKHLKFLWIIPTRNLERSTAMYESVVANAPYSDLAPTALMRIALIYKMRKKSILAADALDRLINNYPNCLLTSDAYLELANTFEGRVNGADYDQGATREAISYYKTFLILYKDNPAVKQGEIGLEEMYEIHAKSKLIMGEFYYHARDAYQSAKVFFNQAITIAPESHSAQEAREYLAIIDQLDKKFPDGRYPIRGVWQHLKFWTSYDPLKVPAPKPTQPEPMAQAQ